jgi:hypothetical protein
MNLLAPLDPHTYGSLLLKQQSIGPGQFEGYNYLGLGVILMLLIGVARKPGLLRAMGSPDWLPLIPVFAICTLLALSTKATLGSIVLYDLRAPAINKLFAMMHASGRLFWPAYYLLIVAGLVATYHSFPRRSASLVLSALMLLQIADIRPLRQAIAATWKESAVLDPLKSPEWREIGARHRHLVVLPAWQCGPDKTPGGMAGFAIFDRLALEHTDSLYASLTARGLSHTQHHCREVDGFWLCSRSD